MLSMVIDMEEAKLRTVAQVRAFLEGTTEVSLRIRKAEQYGFIERTLKRLGYARIPQHCASLVNAFCADYLNPYVNFHRPCFFPETITDRTVRSASATAIRT